MPDWLQSILADTTALQLVFWAIAIGALIAGLIKFWPLLTNIVTIVNALVSLPKFMADTTATLRGQDAKIAEIHHEVNYNNGSSVKDSVDRIELGVKGLYERADAADKADVQLREELERTKPKARPRATKPKEQP